MVMAYIYIYIYIYIYVCVCVCVCVSLRPIPACLPWSFHRGVSPMQKAVGPFKLQALHGLRHPSLEEGDGKRCSESEVPSAENLVI